MILVGGLSVSSGKVWPGVISTLVVVVLDVEVDELTEVYPQSAARIVNVLPVQRLKGGQDRDGVTETTVDWFRIEKNPKLLPLDKGKQDMEHLRFIPGVAAETL